MKPPHVDISLESRTTGRSKSLVSSREVLLDPHVRLFTYAFPFADFAHRITFHPDPMGIVN